MKEPNRREFIKGTTAAAFTSLAAGCATSPFSRAIGSNGRIGMGLIGCGGRRRLRSGKGLLGRVLSPKISTTEHKSPSAGGPNGKSR